MSYLPILPSAFPLLEQVRFPFISEMPSSSSAHSFLAIADLIDPVYIVEAPITFVIKFLIGLLVGLVAHKLGHISTETDNKKVLRWVVLATIAGLAFNAIFDPLLRYFYKILILGKPVAEVSFAINFAVTLLNSVVSAVIVVVLYMALRAPLKKLGLFFRF